MKKGKTVLLFVTSAFLCVLIGIYIGRNTVSLLKTAPDGPGISSMDEFGNKIHSGQIDINIATAHQLQQIPGVGKVLAQNIVDYRTENGYFLSLDELLEVDGIGETRLKEMIPYIYVSG